MTNGYICLIHDPTDWLQCGAARNVARSLVGTVLLDPFTLLGLGGCVCFQYLAQRMPQWGTAPLDPFLDPVDSYHMA